MKNKHLSFKKIGIIIEKDCTTISKEIKNHVIFKNIGAVGRPFFDCIYRYNCPHKIKGTKCNQKLCNHYKKETCAKLKKTPYVCNGCAKRNSCTLSKKRMKLRFIYIPHGMFYFIPIFSII